MPVNPGTDTYPASIMIAITATGTGQIAFDPEFRKLNQWRTKAPIMNNTIKIAQLCWCPKVMWKWLLIITKTTGRVR